MKSSHHSSAVICHNILIQITAVSDVINYKWQQRKKQLSHIKHKLACNYCV